MARMFAALLLTLTVFTGLVWLADRLVWRKQRQEAGIEKEPLIVEYSKSFFPVLLVVLVLRSFVAEPFRIPSQSMLPTLQRGDFILVSKHSYGIHMPAFGTELVETGKPERGDVIVFKYPPDPSKDYIKRVIGLPGDTISFDRGQLFINGELIEQRKIGLAETMDGETLELWEEKLADDWHPIYKRPHSRMLQLSGSFTVPDANYFVMGDNRDNSNDSRVWGGVPEANLSGKAFFIWMNWDWSGDNWPDFDRIGNSIE